VREHFREDLAHVRHARVSEAKEIEIAGCSVWLAGPEREEAPLSTNCCACPEAERRNSRRSFAHLVSTSWKFSPCSRARPGAEDERAQRRRADFSCQCLNVWAHERVDTIVARSLDKRIDAPFALPQIVLEGGERDIQSDVSAEAKAIGDGLRGRGERDLYAFDGACLHSMRLGCAAGAQPQAWVTRPSEIGRAESNVRNRRT